MKPLLDEQTKALIQVGFFKPIDMAAVLVLACSAVTVFFWWAFGAPTWQQLVLILLGAILFVAIWLVILVYRCCFHVIMARSEINTMPEAAAKLAVSYQLGVRTPQ